MLSYVPTTVTPAHMLGLGDENFQIIWYICPQNTIASLGQTKE